MGLNLKKINLNEIHALRRAAEEVWPATYSSILSPKQIEYMMEMMYSEDELRNQIIKGVNLCWIEKQDKNIGFTGLDPEYKFPDDLYIHKLYLFPNLQGLGMGREAMHEIFKMANDLSCKTVSLNVNRFNPAKFFYEKCGFVIKYEENIEIGEGFMMEDFVMQKQL